MWVLWLVPIVIVLSVWAYLFARYPGMGNKEWDKLYEDYLKRKQQGSE